MHKVCRTFEPMMYTFASCTDAQYCTQEMWKTLGGDDKAKYEQLAEKDKERYRKACPLRRMHVHKVCMMMSLCTARSRL
jgi:hypothetical protein